jgi:class 3 adenylate cyclase
MDDAQLKGSESRLWHLIEERSRPGADRVAIDRRIWDLFGETWAVVFTDLAGFSRQVEAFGILHFLEIIWEQKKLLLPIVAAHDGILIKIEADSLLIIFRRPESAYSCAVAMQRACQAWSTGKPPEEHVLLCLGIGYGKILRIGDADVFGAEVNAASKLGEDRAEQHEILVTEAVRKELDGVTTFEPMNFEVPGGGAAYRAKYDR